MSRWQRVLICLTVLAAVALLGPASALATGPSAGDQQYIDPLGGNTSPSGSDHSGQSGSTTSPSSSPVPTTSTPSTSSGATSATSTGTSTGSTATASSTTSAATTSSSTLGADPPGKQLPFTGFDAGAAALIGVLMLGGGMLVRRAVVRDH